MKKKVPLTLLNAPLGLAPRTSVRQRVSTSLRSSGDLSQRMNSLPQALQDAVLDKVALEIVQAQQRKSAKGKGTTRISESDALARLEKVLHEVPVEPESKTIGVLDLGARVGRLSTLLQRLNSGQRRFVFAEVRGPVPAGLVKSPEHLRAWIVANEGQHLLEPRGIELTSAMLTEDVLHVAEVVRQQTHADMLLCISPVLLAQRTDAGVVWNLHAGGYADVCVVSTYRLRDYASQANRPFEAALGLLMVGQVLTWADPELGGYHPETRGCVLDENVSPDEIVVSIRAMAIESGCREKFTRPPDAEAASAMLKALRAMKGN